MPRLKPLDPAAGPLPAFACELRDFKKAAGLTYRQIAEKAHRSHPVFVKAAGGKVLPRWEVVEEFVTICGAAPEQVTRWQERWQETKEALDAITSSARASDPADSTSSPPPQRPPQVGGATAHDGQRPGLPKLYVPDPQQIQTPADFARALRRLKLSAGNPSFRAMAYRTRSSPRGYVGYVSASTLADQCNPARRRFDWATVEVFLDACRVPLDDRRAWGDAFEKLFEHIDRERAARRGPVPQVDLTEIDSPSALAEALTTLRTEAGVSYREIVYRAGQHPDYPWRLGRSALAARIQAAIRHNILLDRDTVTAFVHFCHCGERSCDPQDLEAEIGRWQAVYDQLLGPEPISNAVNIAQPHRSRLIAITTTAAVLVLLLMLLVLV